jgi:hypothetical protein
VDGPFVRWFESVKANQWELIALAPAVPLPSPLDRSPHEMPLRRNRWKFQRPPRANSGREPRASSFSGSDDCVVGTRWRAPMIRLLFTALLSALTSSQATAQNWVSEALLGLNEDQRNETFTNLLQNSNAKCDRVIRTLFIGSTVELDDWECCAEIQMRTRLLSRRNRPQAPNGSVVVNSGNKQNAFA